MSLSLFPSAVRGLGYTVTKSPEDSVLKQRGPSFAETRIIQSQNPIWHWSLAYDFLTDNILRPNSAFAYTDLQMMMGFVTARRNSYDDFLFLDPDDNTVGPGVITTPWLPAFPYALGAVALLSGHAIQVTIAPAGARSGYTAPTVSSSFTDGGLTWVDLGTSTGYPNPKAQLQLVTDGTSWYSPLQINRGGWNFWEDVTDLYGALTVYDAGVPTTNYTLGFGGLSFAGFSSAGMYLTFGYTPTGPITATFQYLYRVRFEDDSEDFEKWANQWWSVGGPEGNRGKGELKLVTSRTPATAFTPVPPMPPIPFPAGSLQFAVLYPTTVTLSNGTGPGLITGQAFGAATGTAASWYDVRLYFQGLGSVGGSAIFSGYALPAGLSPYSIKQVWSYTAYTRILRSHTAGAIGNYNVPGASSGSLFTNIGPSGNYINTKQMDNVSGAPAIGLFPYRTFQQTYGQGALNFTNTTDLHLGHPAVIVFY